MEEKVLMINIKDLAVYIIKKWRILVVATLLCAILLGGYKTVSSINSTEDQYSEENREQIVKKLTEVESNVVENLFNRYLAYKNSISYSESYLSNSILMKLNPEKLPTYTVQYSVVSDQQNIISSFTNQSLGASDYQKIALLFGEDTDSTRISELVAIYGTSSDSDGMSVDVDSHSNIYVGNVNNIYKWIMSLNVYAYNRSQCENVMSIVEAAVDAQYKTLQDAGIDVSLTRIGNNYTENASNWLADRQRSMISETSSLKSEYDKYEKNELSNLSSDEKKYFTFLKNRYEDKEEPVHTLRYYAIGGILGFGALLVLLVVLYFFDDRIRNKEDYVFRVKSDDTIGVLYSSARHRGLINRCVCSVTNKLFYNVDRKYSPSEKATIIAKRICLLCNKNGIKQLYIVNDSSKQTASLLLSSIIDVISKNGITVSCGKPLLSSDDFDEFMNNKAVLYFGSFYDSKAETLADYSKLFKENNSMIVGSVLHGEI